PTQMIASDVRAARLRDLETRFSIRTSTDNKIVAKESDIVLLAVKPQIMATVLGELRTALRPNAVIVAIAAGVPVAAMGRLLGRGTGVVRVMPNTPALVGAGASALCGGNHADSNDLAVARRIFESVGTYVVLDDEALLDSVTGLSGSGPAYVFLIIEALADA